MKKGGVKKGVAHVAHIVAVNMGYGHERPARIMQSLIDGDVLIANDYEGIPQSDRFLWEEGRKAYETISRFKKVPVLGRFVFNAMDQIQKIDDFYPRRDLSAANLQVRQHYFLMRKRGFMKHLIKKLAKDPKPLFCTFMTPAFAAEEFGYPGEIFVLATDADIARAWAPLVPKKTRIRYFAPNGRVVERLMQYGVPRKNIELTGFPLAPESLGGEKAEIALQDLRRRLCNLDPEGRFYSHAAPAIEAYIGAQYCRRVRAGRAAPVALGFTVGGAGAQREIGIAIAKSLRAPIRRGDISLHLIAGARPEVAQYFRDELAKLRMSPELRKGGVQILFEENRAKYFKAFEAKMREIDVLWTKPSELSFYAGLGIPIIIAPTVGSQEDFNHKWIEQIGAGTDQLDPRYTNEWLFDWINSGALARMAWNGFIEAPTHGAYRIRDIILGKPNTIHDLPLVV